VEINVICVVLVDCSRRSETCCKGEGSMETHCWWGCWSQLHADVDSLDSMHGPIGHVKRAVDEHLQGYYRATGLSGHAGCRRVNQRPPFQTVAARLFSRCAVQLEASRGTSRVQWVSEVVLGKRQSFRLGLRGFGVILRRCSRQWTKSMRER
jgi:hypothetical protein